MVQLGFGRHKGSARIVKTQGQEFDPDQIAMMIIGTFARRDPADGAQSLGFNFDHTVFGQ